MKKSLTQKPVNISSPSEQHPGIMVRIKRYRWVIIWCLFHLCALLLSYNEVRFFNTAGEPKPDKFWPFVKFTNSYYLPDNTTYFKFNGFFTQYDWTEFCFYVGAALFFILLRYVYRRSE